MCRRRLLPQQRQLGAAAALLLLLAIGTAGMARGFLFRGPPSSGTGRQQQRCVVCGVGLWLVGDGMVDFDSDRG